MGEPREVGRIGNFHYRIDPHGDVDWCADDPRVGPWYREQGTDTSDCVREVDRLQEENATLRREIDTLKDSAAFGSFAP